MIPAKVRAERAWLDLACLARGHRWHAELHDGGKGRCGRCGKGDHDWEPLPPLGACFCNVCRSNIDHAGLDIRLVPRDGA